MVPFINIVPETANRTGDIYLVHHSGMARTHDPPTTPPLPSSSLSLSSSSSSSRCPQSKYPSRHHLLTPHPQQQEQEGHPNVRLRSGRCGCGCGSGGDGGDGGEGRFRWWYYLRSQPFHSLLFFYMFFFSVSFSKCFWCFVFIFCFM